MNKKYKSYVAVGFVFVVLIIVTLALINSNDNSPCTCEEKNCKLENVGIMDVQVYDWAINEDNLTEMFFEYWIYNYGDSEAKNIVVRCDLWDEEGTAIVSTTKDNYGNLASLSSEFGMMATKDVSKDNTYYIPLCYIESCDNCEILYKRIPDLVDSYESN